MKKIATTLIVFALLANVSAQLKVDSLGNVGIGKNPQYKLDVAGDIYIGSASNNFGKVNRTIKGGSLQSGIYLYSLICDGKTVDTKRMILTK